MGQFVGQLRATEGIGGQVDPRKTSVLCPRLPLIAPSNSFEPRRSRHFLLENGNFRLPRRHGFSPVAYAAARQPPAISLRKWPSLFLRDVAGSYPRALTLPLGHFGYPVAPAIFFWKMAIFVFRDVTGSRPLPTLPLGHLPPFLFRKWQFLRISRNKPAVSTAFFPHAQSDEFSCFSAANLPLNPRCARAVPAYTASAK